MSVISADVEHLALGLGVGIITSINLAIAQEASIRNFGINGIILAGYSRNSLFEHGNVGITFGTATAILLLSSSSSVLRLLAAIGWLQILCRVLVSEIGVVGVKTRGENATFITATRSIGAQAATVMLTASASVMASTTDSVAENTSNACVKKAINRRRRDCICSRNSERTK